MENLDSHWKYIDEFLCLGIFSKIGRESLSFLKSDKNNGTSHEDVFAFVTIYR